MERVEGEHAAEAGEAQPVGRGVRVEDLEEPTMREIRYLDKLIHELAKGKARFASVALAIRD